jgi:fructose-specific component phosphotransferase system IIB-like protein
VSITSTATSICAGEGITFIALPVNGGANPTYQWKINGVDVPGQTAATFTTNNLSDGDKVTVVLTSSEACADPKTALSNEITITTQSVVPSVSITSTATSICVGEGITFTSLPVNGGANPTYQWKINGVDVPGQTAATFTTNNLSDGDKVTVVLTSSEACADPKTALSNEITITTQSVVPSVSITSTATSICVGEGITFTALPVNGGANPTYQWKINGVDVPGQTAATFTTNNLSDGDKVTVVLTSSEACADPKTVLSNEITITTQSVVPSVSITSTATSICAGEGITFTALPVNGGTAPTYHWKVNGVNVAGETAVTFTTSTLLNNDKVTVEMTSSDPCANPATVLSNEITITVYPEPVVTCPTKIDIFCDDKPLVLADLPGVSPIGGTFYLNGNQVTTFTPDCTQTGTFLLDYIYIDANGCMSFCTFTISVIKIPEVSCPANLSVCCDGAPILLANMPGLDPPGGLFYYDNNLITNFIPDCSKPGDHTVTYVYTDPVTTYISRCRFTITVHPEPVVSCPADLNICCDQGPITLASLSGISPAGGRFSIGGTAITEFIPDCNNTGRFVIAYTYEDPVTKCDNTCQFAITVNALPVVTDINTSLCEDPGTPGQVAGVDLTGYNAGISKQANLTFNWYLDQNRTNPVTNLKNITVNDQDIFYVWVRNQQQCEKLAKVTFRIAETIDLSDLNN